MDEEGIEYKDGAGTVIDFMTAPAEDPYSSEEVAEADANRRNPPPKDFQKDATT